MLLLNKLKKKVKKSIFLGVPILYVEAWIIKKYEISSIPAEHIITVALFTLSRTANILVRGKFEKRSAR